MNPSKRTILVCTACVVLGSLGGGYAYATSADEDSKEGPDRSITGSALTKASRAALAATGGGQVTATEVGDEESYYEVEVKKDGRSTDVQLDREFNVVGQEADGNEKDEKDES